MSLWQNLQKFISFGNSAEQKGQQGEVRGSWLDQLSFAPRTASEFPVAVFKYIEASINSQGLQKGAQLRVHGRIDPELPLSRGYRIEILPDISGENIKNAIVSYNPEIAEQFRVLYKKGAGLNIAQPIYQLRSEIAVALAAKLPVYQAKNDSWKMHRDHGGMLLPAEMRRYIDKLCCAIPNYCADGLSPYSSKVCMQTYLNAMLSTTGYRDISQEDRDDFERKFAATSEDFRLAFGAVELERFNARLGYDAESGRYPEPETFGPILNYLYEFHNINGYEQITEGDRIAGLLERSNAISPVTEFNSGIDISIMQGEYRSISDVPTTLRVSYLRDNEGLVTNQRNVVVKLGGFDSGARGTVSFQRELNVVFRPEALERLLNAKSSAEIGGLLSEVKREISRVFPVPHR